MDTRRAWSLVVSGVRRWLPEEEQDLRLEALDHFHEQVNKLERIRKIHQIGPVWIKNCIVCDTPYPCATIRIMDGEQA